MNSIYEIISQDSKYSTISRNISTGKVELVINGVRRPFVKGYMIDAIRSLLRDAGIPEMKGEASKVQATVEEYADDHMWEPEVTETSEKKEKPAWQAKMDVTDKGQILDSSLNDMLFFEYHPDMKGRLYYDEIQQTEMLDGMELNDVALSTLKTDAEKAMGGNRSPMNIKAAALTFCSTHRHNPLKEKLMELKDTWDGEPRLEKVFVEAFGCPDDEYHHYVSKVFFYAWLNRMLQPGCDFDPMFLFIGDHGIGKSKFLIRLLKVIGGKHAEGVGFSGDRDNLEKIASSQLCIMNEMKSMNVTTLEAIKELLGRSVDTFAKKYRSNNNFKRSGIFVGSVNLQYKHILKDTVDYERRFILFDCKAEGTSSGKDPVRMHSEWWDEHFPLDKMEQIWAEVLYLVENEKDFQWQSLPADIIYKLKDLQNECKAIRTDDIFLQKLEDVLNSPVMDDGYDDYDKFSSAMEVAKTALRTPKSGSLQWIKKPVLRRYMKDVMKEDRSASYFDFAMEFLGWKLQVSLWDKETGKMASVNRYIRNENIDKQTVMDL